MGKDDFEHEDSLRISDQYREIRDQGLTRPKVLIIMPFRNSALKTVETMIKSLLPPGKVYTIIIHILLVDILYLIG